MSADLLRREQVGQDLVAVGEANRPALVEARVAPYAIIAREDQLRWSTLVDAFEAARAFLDPVLTGSGGAVWDPTAWRWTVPASPPNPEQD